MPDTFDLLVLLAAVVPPFSAVAMAVRQGERVVASDSSSSSQPNPRRTRLAVAGCGVGLVGGVLSGLFGAIAYVSVAFSDPSSAGDLLLTLGYLALGAICFSAGPGLVALAQHSRFGVVGTLVVAYLTTTAVLSILGDARL